MLFDVAAQPVAVLGETEKVVRFRDFDDFAEKLRPRAVLEAVFFKHELLLADAVKALVVRLVDFPRVVELLQQLLHDLDVARLRRADVVVVGNVQVATELEEKLRGLVAALLRRNAALLRRLLDLLPVLVESGEEMHRLAVHAVKARDRVGEHFLVSVSEVRSAVGVIDGGRQIKRLAHMQVKWIPWKKF